jgi:hypothetical protein
MRENGITITFGTLAKGNSSYSRRPAAQTAQSPVCGCTGSADGVVPLIKSQPLFKSGAINLAAEAADQR